MRTTLLYSSDILVPGKETNSWHNINWPLQKFCWGFPSPATPLFLTKFSCKQAVYKVYFLYFMRGGSWARISSHLMCMEKNLIWPKPLVTSAYVHRWSASVCSLSLALDSHVGCLSKQFFNTSLLLILIKTLRLCEIRITYLPTPSPTHGQVCVCMNRITLTSHTPHPTQGLDWATATQLWFVLVSPGRLQLKLG